jgi:hypothetical protein
VRKEWQQCPRQLISSHKRGFSSESDDDRGVAEQGDAERPGNSDALAALPEAENGWCPEPAQALSEAAIREAQLTQPSGLQTHGQRDELSLAQAAPFPLTDAGAGDDRSANAVTTASPDSALGEPQGTPLDLLSLLTRTHNALRRNGIDSVEALCALSVSDVLAIRHLGNGTLAGIQKELALVGRSLAVDTGGRRDGRQQKRRPNAYGTDDSYPREAGGGASPPTKMDLSFLAAEQRSERRTLETESRGIAPALANCQTPILRLDLGRRALNCLLRAKVHTVGQAAAMSEERLLGIRHFGVNSLADLRSGLDRFGASLGDSARGAPDANVLSRQHLGDDRTLDTLFLPPGTSATLARAGFDTVGQLAACCDEDLMWLVPSGAVIVNECRAALSGLAPRSETLALAVEEPANRGIATTGGDATIEVIIRAWLASTSDRNRDVVCQHLGLGCEAGTLQEVGENHGLTRERVRQIVARQLGRLRHAASGLALREHIASAIALVRRMGGIMTAEDLDEYLPLCLPLGDIKATDAAMLLALASAELEWLEKAELLVLTELERGTLAALWDDLECGVGEGDSAGADDLVFRVTSSWAFRNARVTEETVRAALRCHPKLTVADGRVSSERRLRGAPPKALVETRDALRRIGHPAHFGVIAAAVAEIRGQDGAPAEHTIHARMMRFPDTFARVGRGIYALTEWGLANDGSVASAVVRVLEEAGEPLSIAQVKARVLEDWQVQENTIYQALLTDPRIVSVMAGIYGLATWSSSR